MNIGVFPLAAYRTFYRRLVAAILDAFVLAPVVFAQVWVDGAIGGSRGYAISVIAGGILFFTYSIVLHARYGQTLGKRAMAVLVLDISGRDITARQAVMRELPNIALAVASLSLHAPVLLRGGEPFTSDALTTTELADGVLTWTWMALEVVTMLTNEKRRSVHDFIAGTVVVRLDRWVDTPQDAASESA